MITTESILLTNEISNIMYIEAIILFAIFLCSMNYNLDTKSAIVFYCVPLSVWVGLMIFDINIDFEQQNQWQMFGTSSYTLLAKTIVGFFVLYIINIVKYKFSFFEIENKKLVRPDDKIILILYNWLGLCLIISTKD
jgi:hypothetical protein